MKTKYFLASLSLVGLFAACQNEEFVTEQTNNVLKGRPTVNLTLENGADTRLAVGEGDVVNYNGTDALGAVIVDPAALWDVQQGHVGNNKFYYDANERKFKTDGTTAIGSWVFYTQYSSDMTTQRDAITYSFKQIQEGDATSVSSTAAGVDFFVSPVVQLDGYEGEDLNFAVQTPSIHTRAVIDLKFNEGLAVKEVQKIVVAATKGTKNKEFILKGQIENEKLAVADIRKPLPYNQTENSVIAAAAAKMSNAGTYSSTTLKSAYVDIATAQKVDNATVKFLALDCISHDENATAKPVENNEFKSIMMLPAGEYSTLTLYIYTDRGIYKKVIKNATPEDEDAKPENFWLRRGHRVNLANITKSAKQVTEKLTIKEEDFIDNTAAENETEGTVVLKTDDLVEAIKAIETNGNVKINVMSDDNHKTVINKEVMDALAAVKATKPNVQLIFTTPMIIEGESAEAPLKLHDISFEGSATLTTGCAVVDVDINIPANQRLTVKNGTSLTVAAAASTPYKYTRIANEGTVSIESSISMAALENYAEVNIAENVALTTTHSVKNNGTINNAGTWNAECTVNVENTSVDGSAATINNTGIINVSCQFNNNHTVVNEGIINVMNTFSNVSKITNAESSLILVKTGAADTSALNNTGEITNYGDMYCNEGKNTINNTGKIFAKDGATTYITTNSSADELKETTNNVTMGEIELDNRKGDVSVTTDTQKGYISIKTSLAKIEALTGDKFNKVYLSASSEITSDAVKYIVVEAGATEVTLNNRTNKYQELTFNAASTILATPADKVTVAKLTVAKDIRVKLPTENLLGVYEVKFDGSSMTTAAIDNKGTILVGGDFWSLLSQPTTGTFASGDGNTTAFHWGKDWNKPDTPPATGEGE